MAIAWVVFDVCDKEVILNALKNPEGFTFLNCSWRNDEEIASREIQLYPEKVFYANFDCYNLRNRMVRIN